VYIFININGAVSFMINFSFFEDPYNMAVVFFIIIFMIVSYVILKRFEDIKK